MKKIILLMLIFVMAFSAGCSKTAIDEGNEDAKSEEPDMMDISGTYYAISCSDSEGNSYVTKGEVLELGKDGRGSFAVEKDICDLEWSYDGRELHFIDSDGDEFHGTFSSGMIQGTYFDGVSYMFTDDEELAAGIWGNEEIADDLPASDTTEEIFFRKSILYDDRYGIRTANAIVPEGWSSDLVTEWGLISTMYPAAATVVLKSPDGDAMIEIRSTCAFLQMARNGSWVPEGTYLDFYNTFLDYRDAGGYNDYVLGLMGYQGTVLDREGPDYESQLSLNGEANTLLSALSSSDGAIAKGAEGSHEKTSYFITSGDQYEIEIVSSVIMADIIIGSQETIEWIVPFTACFSARSEEAYGRYRDIFDVVVANTTFSDNFLYVVNMNAAYLNEMMRQYLLEQAFKPGDGDISSWNDSYADTGNDRWINEWDDVIKEEDTYITESGDMIKVPTKYDSVYQNGDLIYIGPADTEAGVDWTPLEKKQ